MLKSKYIIVIIICCFVAMNGVSQHKLSKYEIRWVVFHPCAAKRVKRLLPEAMLVYNEVKNAGTFDTNESGGKLDAFRHIFTMAFLSQTIKIRKLRRLGIAHEKDNKHHFYKDRLEFGERADSLACVMDLRNNDLGFEIGANNRLVTKDSLKLLVTDRIKAGDAWYLKRNAKNEYVSCENEPITIENYRKKWFLPKCLIKTNE